MASSNIKLFDENKGNMLTDTEFNISTQRLNGLQAGVASSQLQNKAMYQASLVAYAIAQIMMQNGLNANDKDAVSTFVANLSGTMLQKVYDLATTAEAQAGVATGKWMSPALVKAAIDKTLTDKNYLQKSGGTMIGNLILNANPTADLGAATKQYVDSGVNSLSNKATSINDSLAAIPTNLELIFEKAIAGSNSITIPSDAKYAYVYAVGAGGGGSGGAKGSTNAPGGGGGGAGYAMFVGPIDVSSITDKTVVIGAGGAGGAGSKGYELPGNGNDGGTTIVFGVIKAAGGSGGVYNSKERAAGSAKGGIGATSPQYDPEIDGEDARNVTILSLGTIGGGGGGGSYSVDGESPAGTGGTGSKGSGGAGGKAGTSYGKPGSNGGNGGTASGGGGGGAGNNAAGGKGGAGGPGYVAIWISRNKKAF